MSRKKDVYRAVALVTVIAILVLFSLKLYYVRPEAWGELFWNDESAYIFIGEGIDGYRFSYPGFAAERIREILPFSGSRPDDRHFSVTALQVTGSSVDAYSADNIWMGGIESFQRTLYVPNLLPNTHLMKWDGAGLEPTTPEERENLHQYLIGLPKGPPAGPSYDNVEGWSKRTLSGQIVDRVINGRLTSVEKDANVTIDVKGQQLTFVMNSGFISHHAYVNLIRAGQRPERIWQMDERPHRVSRSEYEKVFEKH